MLCAHTSVDFTCVGEHWCRGRQNRPVLYLFDGTRRDGLGGRTNERRTGLFCGGERTSGGGTGPVARVARQRGGGGGARP